jgi:hypothetical protein
MVARGTSAHCCGVVTVRPDVANTATPAPATTRPAHTSFRFPFNFGVFDNIGVFDQPFGAVHSSTATIKVLNADDAEIRILRFCAPCILKSTGQPGSNPERQA